MSHPRTIQVCLPAGDPRGMRVAEVMTRIIRVIEVPRSQLDQFLRMPEAQQMPTSAASAKKGRTKTTAA